MVIGTAQKKTLKQRKSLLELYLREAQKAVERGEKITQYVQRYSMESGVSLQAAYKSFGESGVVAPRKPRSDRGDSKLSKDDVLSVAALQERSRRHGKNKRPLPATVAVETLVQDGIVADASVSTYRRQMKAAHLDRQSRDQAPPYTELRSLRPGDVFQIDASQAAQWYLVEGRFSLDRDGDMMSYKLEKRREAVLKRYIVTDHYTSAFWVYYTYAKGESVSDFIRCLWEGCCHKGEEFPMGGLPRLLYSDKGSALQNAVAESVFSALNVNYHAHLPGNPRAKGTVETRHGWWEARFENRLLALGIKQFSLAQLNELAFQECKRWNETVTVERTGYKPFVLWRKVVDEHPEAFSGVRYPPDWDAMRELMVGKVYTAKVRGDWSVRFEKRLYSLVPLKGYDCAQPGSMIEFCRDSYDVKSIVIDTDDGQRHVLAPVALGLDGRPMDAPVLGIDYKSKPDDMATTARKAALAYKIPDRPLPDRVVALPGAQQANVAETPQPQRMVSRPAWIDAWCEAHPGDAPREAALEYRIRYGAAIEAPLAQAQEPTKREEDHRAE